MNLSRKSVGSGALFLVMIGFIVLLAIGLFNRSAVTGLSGFRLINKPAPDFTLPLLDGGEISMAQIEGQPVVINFWASWCAPCVEESPVLEKAWRDSKDDGVMFIGVQIQDTENAGRRWLDEFDITYPNGLDKKGEITIDYGVIGIPVTFFVNKMGVVERRFVGAVKQQQMSAWIDELVAGVAPTGEVDGENPDSLFDLN